MRRRTGGLVPLEVSILEVAIELRGRGVTEIHGFQLAKELRGQRHARRLTAYGTLYKALDRLTTAGLLSSRWEDPQLAATAGRPRRRFYRITPSGEAALADEIERRVSPTQRRSAAAVRT